MCRALAQIGLVPEELHRGALRTMIHASTGEPPANTLSNDELAQQVIGLHRARRLRRARGD